MRITVLSIAEVDVMSESVTSTSLFLRLLPPLLLEPPLLATSLLAVIAWEVLELVRALMAKDDAGW